MTARHGINVRREERPDLPDLADAPVSVAFALWAYTGEDTEFAEGVLHCLRSDASDAAPDAAKEMVASLVAGESVEPVELQIADMTGHFGVGPATVALRAALRSYSNPKGGPRSAAVRAASDAIEAELKRGRGERFADDKAARERVWLAIHDWLAPTYQLQDVAEFIVTHGLAGRDETVQKRLRAMVRARTVSGSSIETEDLSD